MQWGILQGNDPFLYGEKVKAYFTRGARHLPGYDAVSYTHLDVYKRQSVS